MATLVFKVFALTIRTVSKPLAARLNQTLLSHLTVRGHLVRIANVSPGIGGARWGEPAPGTFGRGVPRSAGAWQPCDCTGTPPSLIQAMHRAEVRLTRAAEGKSSRVFIADMAEEHALEVVSKVVTETILYSVRSRHWRRMACLSGNLTVWRCRNCPHVQSNLRRVLDEEAQVAFPCGDSSPPHSPHHLHAHAHAHAHVHARTHMECSTFAI